MSAGLSRLQRFILGLAAQYGIVFSDDIKAAFFGFPRTWRDRGGVGAPFQFSRDAIGASKYDAASVSTSRAFARLERRGLLKKIVVDYKYCGGEINRWDNGKCRNSHLHEGCESGWILTEQGEETVKAVPRGTLLTVPRRRLNPAGLRLALIVLGSADTSSLVAGC